MNTIPFYKYQGTGNDFVMIDNRSGHVSKENLALIRILCERRFGIGADGLILIETCEGYDFEMVYFNSDGSMSMCGNGARCAVRFAYDLGIINDEAKFLAIDGPHTAYIKEGLIHLKMGRPGELVDRDGDVFINTGSPHHIRFVKNLLAFDVVLQGRKIRNGAPYFEEGTNVNFVEKKNGKVHVRTYERGVENETYSCGTGVTAVALALSQRGEASPVKMQTMGGELQVSFKHNGNGFDDVYLIGPAKMVFQGEITPEILEATP